MILLGHGKRALFLSLTVTLTLGVGAYILSGLLIMFYLSVKFVKFTLAVSKFIYKKSDVLALNGDLDLAMGS